MALYEIRGAYPTQGADAHDWGVPEDHLSDALVALAPAVDAQMVGAGTNLWNGDRDVQFEVKADDTFALSEVLDTLPEDERHLWWVFEVTEEEE